MRGIDIAFFIMGFLVSFLLTSFFFMSYWTPTSYWQSQTIQRGYALYCPTDGKFAWIGECEVNK